jgi:hypothetical protein
MTGRLLCKPGEKALGRSSEAINHSLKYQSKRSSLKSTNLPLLYGMGKGLARMTTCSTVVLTPTCVGRVWGLVTRGLLCVSGVKCFKLKEILILYIIVIHKYLLQKKYALILK